MKRTNPDLEIRNLRVESGNAARAKAAHRDEVQREYLSKPFEERLEIALSMVGVKKIDPGQR